MNLDIERADYMRHRGRTATLSIGPFRFHANTADGGLIGFEVVVGQWSWGWTIEGGERG